jgi:hypothetical protein
LWTMSHEAEATTSNLPFPLPPWNQLLIKKKTQPSTDLFHTKNSKHMFKLLKKTTHTLAILTS